MLRRPPRPPRTNTRFPYPTLFPSEKRPAPGGLHHIPAIGRGLGIVDDEHGGGALPGRLLELVGPAAVIGHRPALEIALPQRLLPVRIVDEDDDRLSLYVDIRIIVPADRKSTRLNSSH